MELSNMSVLEQRARYLMDKLSIKEFEVIKIAEKQLEEEINIEGGRFMIIDLTELQAKQQEFITWLESKPNMINEKNKFGVTKKQVLATISELYEVGNEAKQIYKWWDKSDIKRDKLLEELSDVLSHILNLANALKVELVIDSEIKQVDDLEDQLISLTYDLLRFTNYSTNNVFHKRRLKELLLPQYLTFVYSLGFNFEELEDAFNKKMHWNYNYKQFS